MKRGRRSAALRFDSELELQRLQAERRERFQRGAIATPERDILAAALELLQRHPAVALAQRINTGAGWLLDGRTYHELIGRGALLPHGAARFMRFGFPGAADLQAVFRGSGRLIAVECKSDRGQLTDDQAAYLDAVNQAGGLGLCVRAVDELAEALR